MSAAQVPVFLIGPRCCGKSTAGLAAARLLGRDFCDTDELVVTECGRSVAEIVAGEGWEGFRRRESRALAGAASGGALVATGGGAVLAEGNRRLMRASGLVVYLTAPPELLRARLAADEKKKGRPSLTGEDPLRELAAVIEQREALYRECAHYCIDASPPAAEVAGAIARLLAGSLPAG